MLTQNHETIIRVANAALDQERWTDFETIHDVLKANASTERLMGDADVAKELDKASDALIRKYRDVHEALDQENWIEHDGGRADAGHKGSAGDCVTRACAIALQLPYEEVWQYYQKDFTEEDWTPDNGVQNLSSDKFLRERGWEIRSFSGTVKEAAEAIEDGIISCNMMGAGHFVAAKDSKYLDTWNSGWLRATAVWTPSS